MPGDIKPPAISKTEPEHSEESDSSHYSSDEDDETMSTPTDLSILLKFIKPYDGNRETLNSFIVNCDNAFDLANTTQKPTLFKYILCQLQGKAEVACSIKEFTAWEQLKEFLKTQFSERKHYTHLLTDLQEGKQAPNENVNQFSLRVETCLSQLLTEISLSGTKVKEVSGRTAAMEDLALHHFIMGLNPRISSIIRCKSPKNLNEAINYAISEERIQQTIYKKNISTDKPQRNMLNYRNPGPSSSGPSQGQRPFNTFKPRPPFNNPPTNQICRYCKAPGHTIDNCRKREFNNNRAQNPNPRPSTSYNPRPQIHYIEDDVTEDEGHDEVDLIQDKAENLNE